MANRKASIWPYKKIDGRWRYVKPAMGRNGKIKSDPDAAYYVRYREGGKMIWRKCSVRCYCCLWTTYFGSDRRKCHISHKRTLRLECFDNFAE